MKKRYIAAAAVTMVFLGAAVRGAAALEQYSAEIHETIPVIEGSAGQTGGVQVIARIPDAHEETEEDPAENSFRALLRSESQYEAYAYMALRIPLISAGFSRSPERILCDAAVPHINEEYWELIRETTGSEDGGASCYIYRLREPLSPGADSPDLFTDMSRPDFDALDERFSGTVSLRGCLLQKAAFTDAGGLERADEEAELLLGEEPS